MIEVEIIQISLDEAQNMLIPPTIAEEHIARMLAMWHGQTPLYRNPQTGVLMTVANSHSMEPTGWAWEVDRYVERHWKEYLAAARAVMELR